MKWSQCKSFVTIQFNADERKTALDNAIHLLSVSSVPGVLSSLFLSMTKLFNSSVGIRDHLFKKKPVIEFISRMLYNKVPQSPCLKWGSLLSVDMQW